MPVIFNEKREIEGIPGNYPFTAENLFRVGLALCTLWIIDKEFEKPVLSIKEANFVTLSLAVGFMNAGGDVVLKEKGDIELALLKGNTWRLKISPFTDADLKKLESMLFGRYPIPKRASKDIGLFRC